MEENRKKLTLLALAGTIVLIMMIGYPILKTRIKESRQQEISLGQEQTQGPVEEMQKEMEKREMLTLSGEETSLFPEGQSSEQPMVFLGIQVKNAEIQIPLWISTDQIGYFFFPGFTKGEKLTLKKMEGEVLRVGEQEVREGDILSDVREEEAYPIELISKEGQSLLKIPVFFLYSSELPTMFLSTASGSMEDIDGDKQYQEEGRVMFCDETGEILYAGEAEEIGGRGNSTWGLSKKPYQFKLVEEADFFGSGAAKSWNLLANGYDETRLRNQIAFNMARELGMNYVPDGKMIDLYINHIYYGNYYLVEKIRVGEESVALRNMEEIQNTVYNRGELDKLEIVENRDQTRKWVTVDDVVDDISGGYLFERELSQRYQQEVSGFVTDQGDCYVLQNPSYASKEQVEYIADLMQQFQDAVEQGDGIHPETGKAYSEYIDLESFAQKYLVEEISKNYDGGVTSSFFYKPEDTVSPKIYAGPVWDYDVSFGNCNLDEIASNPKGITKLNNHVQGTNVFKYLYEKKDFYNTVVILYRDKAVPYLEYLLDKGIDQMVLTSRQSARLDSIRWENLENRYQYYKDYDSDVRYLKYFIEKRMEFLNQVWLQGEIYHNVTFTVEGEPWQIFCIKDGEAGEEEPVPYRHAPVSIFVGWVTEEGVPYDRYKPVYEDMAFYPIWQEIPAAESNPN